MSNLGTVSLNGGGGGGSGTVTSVAMSVPTQFSVAGSPVTTSGTLAVTWVAQVANSVLSGPSSGADAAPTFRALVSDDIPTLAKAKISTTGAWTAPEYVTMVGDSGAGGVKGAVPAPAAGDAAAGKFLKADGTWVTPGGAGTVTSVGLSAPTQFSVSGSPVTGSGTLALSWAVQVANRVLAGPSSGADAAPTFRALVSDDLPVVAVGKGGTGTAIGIIPTGTMLVSDGTGTFKAFAVGAANQALRVNSGGTDPEWGTLGVAGGGSGLATLTAYALMAGGTTATGAMQQVSGVGTSGQVLTSNGAGALPTWQTPAAGSATWESTGGQFRAKPAAVTAGDYFYYNPSVANSGTNVAHVFDNSVTLSGNTKLASWRNNTVEKAFIADNGALSAAIGTCVITPEDFGTGADLDGQVALGPATTGLVMYSGFYSVGMKRTNESVSFAWLDVGNFAGSEYDWSVLATKRVVFDATAAAGVGPARDYTAGDTYFTKSASSGGNFSYFYDGTEVLRDDGTNVQFLQSRKPGIYNAMGDTGPRATWGGNQLINVTEVGNVGTGVDDLQSVSLKTDTLLDNDDRIEILASGSYAANGNNKTVKLLFGGTTVFDTGAVAANGGGWVIRATVVRTGATTQVAVGFYVGSSLVTSTVTHTTPAETLSSAIVIKTQGEATADNDVVSKILTVDYFPTK